MAVYLVNQGKTYRYEREGGFIWSPKLNKAAITIKDMTL